VKTVTIDSNSSTKSLVLSSLSSLLRAYDFAFKLLADLFNERKSKQTAI